MNKTVDPRTLGFNYGQPLPFNELPSLYHELEAVAQGYRDEAQTASRKAWALDELLRRARQACNTVEREMALAKLREFTRRSDLSYGGTAAGDHAALVAI